MLHSEEFLEAQDPVLIIAVLAIIVLLLFSWKRFASFIRCLFGRGLDEEPEDDDDELEDDEEPRDESEEDDSEPSDLTQLGEYCNIVSGNSYSGKYIDKPGVKLLGIGTIIEGGGFNAENVRDYSGGYLETQVLKPGDTYIALTSLTEITRPFLGSPAVVPDDFDNIGITTHHVGRVDFNADSEMSSFCKWIFRSERFRQYCMYMCTGTTVFAVKPDDVLRFTMPSSLSTHQRNLLTTLGQLERLEWLIIQLSEAKKRLMWTIFRSRFIDFNDKKTDTSKLIESEFGEIPSNWSVGKLEDYLKLIKKPTKSGPHLSDRQYVPIDRIERNNLFLYRWNDWKEAASSLILFEKDDLLFGAMRAYFHKVAIAPFAGVTRTTCFVLRPKKPEWLPFCTMLLNLESTVRFASDSSLGSTMPYAVWDGTLARHKVIKPPEYMIDEYSKECMPLLESIRDSGLKLNQCRRAIKDLVRELSQSY